MEGTSQELEIYSSRKKISRFENFKTASSSKGITYDDSSLVSKTSQDLTNQNSKQFSKKFMQDSRASGLNEAGKQLMRSCSRGKVYSCSLKGKEILQASDFEQLSERLKILEEETKVMKQEFIETMEDRKKLMNEIYQELLTIQHCDCLGNQATGLKFLYESSIVNLSDKAIMGIGLSQVLCEHSNPFIVTSDHRANLHFTKQQLKHELSSR